MKKSAMINRIEEYLRQVNGCVDESIMAEGVLAIIEKEGMLPPTQDILVTRDYGSFCIDGEREWEKE